ncbi:UvrD-helicase domain-containing protein [Bacteroides caecigallinarum]|nr:UvrD-helicase domain-containing protein [Bacteroides caecigallinarum]
MTDYLDELNESQRAAVLYNEGPSLVIAGAGSGKTRVLTYKIAYLLDNGYEPWSILALTFTNKAAREMKERISRAVGNEKAKYLWMGTFHSVFARILRTEAAALGYSSNFTIYDSSDSKSLIKSLLKELNLDEKVYKPGLIQSRISNAKNHLVSAQAYAASSEFFRSDSEAKIPAMRDIYIRYCERCKQSDAMDFDDLLVNTYLLFKNHPDICEKYADRFRYVLVDEYQDTNFAQHSIVLQLTSKHQRVCVVGDDAQSIYSFRGANIDNILKFTRLYNDARLFKLEQNYRSTQLIVKAANSLIEKNREQIRKEVFSENSVGEPITVTCAYSDVEEGEIVANKITSMHVKNGYPYSDFAILYRTNAQSRIFEEALRKRAVAYRIYGGLSFYQRKEIKDVIAYFRLAVNPHDGEALKRVINYPARGIGDTTLNKIIATAAQEGVSLWTVISSPLDYGLNINKGTHAKLQGFKDIIADFVSKVDTYNAYDLGKEIVGASGIMADIIQDTSPEGLSRRENIYELVNGMYDFCDIRRQEGNERMFLTDYLSEVSLLTDQDGEKDDSVPKVTLMTIHSAKGLEFRNVFIVGMEENLFPGPMSSDSPRALEEERRLFYVAITRAEENCFISYAKNRYKYGKPEFCNPSRFLKDINPDFLKMPADSGFTPVRNEGYTKRNYERGYERNETYRSSGPSMFDGGEMPQEPVRFVKPVPPRNLKRIVPVSQNPAVSRSAETGKADTHGVEVGRLIEHERFGRGEVVRLEGSGDNCKATVRFENAGDKQLLLKFARFKIIG